MPWADNGGTRIHYEICGTGPALVLQHGFTQCLKDWVECGYVSALEPKYRLVLIDARGHGESDKPLDEASYTLERRVTDVTAVLDDIGIEKAHFWGYSMGGFIGFGMATQAPKRVDALVIGGSHPFERDPEVNRRWLREAIAGGGDALVSIIERMAGPVSAGYAARLRATDLAVSVAAVPSSPSMRGKLLSISMRSYLYSGEDDPVFAQAKLASELIPNAQFQAFAGLRHLPAFSESRVVLPPVMAFLANVRP